MLRLNQVQQILALLCISACVVQATETTPSSIPALESDAVWDSMVNLTPNYRQFLGYGHQRTVATDSFGNVHVAWYDKRTSPYQIGYRKYDNATSTWLPETILTDVSASCRRPSLACDISGNVHVVWYTTTQPDYGIWYKKYDVQTGSWQPDTLLYDPGDALSQNCPAVTCPPNGDNVHVVWRGMTVPGGSYVVFHKEFVPGVGWQAETQLSAAAHPSIAVDNDNNVYVAWAGYGVELRRRISGVWQDIETVYFGGNAPSVAVSSTGTDVHVVWHYGTPDEILYRRRAPGGWVEVKVIGSDSLHDQQYPSITCHPSGLCDVVWYGETVNSPSDDQVIHTTRYPSGLWSEPRALTDFSTDVDDPCVVNDRNLGIHIVWERRSDIWYRRGIHATNDVILRGIVAPRKLMFPATTVAPEVIVFNDGVTPHADVPVFLAIDSSGTQIYLESDTIALLVSGDTAHVVFADWTSGNGPSYLVTAWTLLPGDENPANDTSTRTVEPVFWETGWHEVARMPRGVYKGGWLALMESNGKLYASRGTDDFYEYDPMADIWLELGEVPRGNWGRGGKGVTDGSRYVYTVIGDNTLLFWLYDVPARTWRQLPDVPLGLKRKKVKGGGDMEYITIGDTGYVYFLKGYKTEFYRYNTVSDTWETLRSAPAGIKDRWKRGSWIVYDQNRTIYAHKARYIHNESYHELWKYDVPCDTWHSQMLPGMPYWGQHGSRIRRKKSRDGGSAVWYAGNIYALKGGNTQQFWKYTLADSSWRELDTIPRLGSDGKKKRVKYGGDIVLYDQTAFFVLKGNKSSQFWRYMLPAYGSPLTAHRSGVMASKSFDIRKSSFAIIPNPLAARFATLRYTLPKTGPVSITIYDVAGRAAVRSQRLAVSGRRSAVTLDLQSLSRGVYLVRLEADDFAATRKLVVQR